jgi:hypothetical protein
MGLFGFGKKDKVLDLSEKYKMQVARAEQVKKAQTGFESSSSGNGPFSFFDSPDVTSSSSSDTVDLSDTSEERKRKLARRISDMTGKMEDLSNQIYHLQQRIEVLERKLDIRRV